MTTWAKVTIIVPATHVDQAREIGAALDSAGVGMYTTALSPSGAEPATHYVSSGLVSDAFVYLLENYELLYQSAMAGAESQGLPEPKITLEDARYLQENSLVDYGDVHAFLETSGLKLMTTD